MTLLIVLLSLGLVLLLVVSYLAGVTSNLADSDAYASSLNVQEVANSALQMTLSQIQTGTTGGTTVAWASQPGAIRTYDNAGNMLAVYKLYSSSQMIVNTNASAGGAAFNPQNDWAPTTWSSTPGLYIDLNEPVTSNGQSVYPIFDPAATATVTTAMNPAATGTDPLVEGCSINSTSPSPVAGASNTAAMPVQWIYQLKDGTMVVPTTANGKVTTIPNATNANPPMARFAFWADDETCKLNVNTASEGSYWDTPMMVSPAELYFGRYQPAQREYQRYPGHPATTCLSPVLWSLWGLPGPESSLLPSLNPTLTGGYFNTQLDSNPTLPTSSSTYFKDLFGILPKLVWGGSKMGTQATDLTTAAGLGAATIASTSLDSDRLFASPGDFLFGRPGSSTAPRPANSANGTALSQATLEKFRFFLTTSSKAPDVNMFNQPKICIWPENDTTKKNPSNSFNTASTNLRTPIDQLIAFCSTINSYPYYFTRNDPNNPTGDFTTRNQTLYNYLTGLMSQPIPGFGAAFTPTRYSANQSNQIITEIYDYIRSAINLIDTSDTVAGGTPTYTYAFAPGLKSVTWNPGAGQVVPFQLASNGTKGIGRYVTVKQAVVWFIAKAANQPPVLVNSAGQPIDSTGAVITSVNQSFVVNPLHPWTGTPGTLPVPTFTSGGVLQPFATITRQYPTLTSTATGGTAPAQTHSGLPYLTTLNTDGTYDLPNPRYQGPTLTGGQTQIQAVFFLDMVNNAVGFVGSAPNFAYEVTGLQAFQANGTSLNFTPDKTHIAIPLTSTSLEQYAVEGPPRLARVTGGTEGYWAAPLLTFVSSPVTVTNSSSTPSTFAFTGGTITVTIKQASNTTVGSTVQTLNIPFPNATFPVPVLPPSYPLGFLAVASATYPGAGNHIPYPPKYTDDLVPTTLLTLDSGDTTLATGPNVGATTAYPYSTNVSRLVYPNTGTFVGDPNAGPGGQIFLPLHAADPGVDDQAKLTCDTIRSVEFTYGDTRIEACLPTISASVASTFFTPHADYFSSTLRPAHSLRGSFTNAEAQARGGTAQPLTNMTFSSATPTGIYFAANWGSGSSASTQARAAALSYTGTGAIGSLFPHTASSTDFTNSAFAAIWANGGDFDNANSELADGPFINKPDEGTVLYNQAYANAYFDSYNLAHTSIGSTLFSANRQVPSPVIFGSLPAGVDPNNPTLASSWTTLLFCPNPNSSTHIGLGANPPDYALLDFFHMPVVEPYAISEPLSTAGMVNMNYQIVPFSYIKRDTALRGVLKSVMLTAIPDNKAYYYKGLYGSGDNFGDKGGPQDIATKASGYWSYRYPIAATETLKQFDAKFATNDIFHSPSQICSLWLYPATQPTATAPNNPATPLVTYDSANANISAWWYNGAGTTRKSLTGTNLRDRPYALLYPRLTTKSNTYTVHVRAQVLRVPSNSGNTLDETTSRTVAEWRGSYVVERNIDPNNTALPDFASNTSAAVDPYYTFRTLSTRRFSP